MIGTNLHPYDPMLKIFQFDSQKQGFPHNFKNGIGILRGIQFSQYCFNCIL